VCRLSSYLIQSMISNFLQKTGGLRAMQGRYVLDFGDVTHGKYAVFILFLRLFTVSCIFAGNLYLTIIHYVFMCAGDPLYEFLAMHVSVFKLDPLLLKVALVAYGLPLTIPNGASAELPGAPLGRDYTRPSYRAM
jgi:hypothetical protein